MLWIFTRGSIFWGFPEGGKDPENHPKIPWRQPNFEIQEGGKFHEGFSEKNVRTIIINVMNGYNSWGALHKNAYKTPQRRSSEV